MELCRIFIEAKEGVELNVDDTENTNTADISLLLCNDILLSIMAFLKCGDIAKISRTNEILYRFCNCHDALWKVLVERDCNYCVRALFNPLLWKDIYKYSRMYHTKRTNDFCKNINEIIEREEYEEFLEYKLYNWNILMENLNDYNTTIFLNMYKKGILKYIIDNTIDLECEIKEGYRKGWIPIQYICMYSTQKMQRYIIKKGVDLECEITEGWYRGYRPINFIFNLNISNAKTNSKCLCISLYS